MNAIEMRNGCFSYGETMVLREAELTVPVGEMCGLAGESGSGKSTLLKLVAGLYRLNDGSLSVMGETDPDRFRDHVALVSQSAPLFPTSIRLNVTCGKEMPESRVLDACEAAALGAWLRTLPEGLDTFVGDRGGRVSGGQAQRIAVARAIARNAPLILLDEATSALDDATAEALLQALDRLAAGRTVLSVAHRPEALNRCGRVLRLEGGVFRE